MTSGSDDGLVSPSGFVYDFSNIQTQKAISIDFTAWEWLCEISWEASALEIEDSSNNNSVLQTNYAVDYQGTDVDEVGVADDEYEVKFQAQFNNGLGQICDPSGSVCIDLQQSFSPLQQLKGDTDGNGEVVLNSKDTLTG